MAKNRAMIAIVLFIIFFLIGMAIRFSPLFLLYAHTSITHTLIQSIATIIALFCGCAALYRFYSGSKMSGMLLFLGVGFIGTGLIDAYHAVVTTGWFDAAFPKINPSVAEWSWFATRAYLAVFVIISLWALSKSTRSTQPSKQIDPKKVYLYVGILTLLDFLVFVTIRVPYPVYPDQFLCRPWEIAAGILFLIALIAYLKQGNWKTDKLAFWMVLFLVTNVCAQFFYIDLAPHKFDTLYLSAHGLKIISYLMVYFAVSE